MAKGKEIPLNLRSYDELFMGQQERDDLKREKVEDVGTDLLDPFPDHPFQVREDESMVRLVENVSKAGILTPIIVRPKEDGRYELISGHRRKRAAELAGLGTVPAIVRDLSHDEAVIAMVDSNLQREEVLPSEKAFSYKMKLDALKRQGQRSDITSCPLGAKFTGRADAHIAEHSDDSARQIQRYIRLTELIPDILTIVDEKGLGMRPAVELSYLPKKEQVALFEAMECELCVPSHAQAIKLRKFSEDRKLSPDVITSIMSESKPNQAEQFKIRSDKISKYFKPGTSREEKEARIIKGLELLEKAERKRDRER